MPEIIHKRTPVQKIARTLIHIIGGLLLLVILLFLFLLTPPGQRVATRQTERFLEKKLKTRVEIGNISIGLPRKVVLTNVYLEDQTKDTLLSGGTIRANIDIFALFSNAVLIKDLELTDITAKVKRLMPDTAFNFQFVIDAFVVDKRKRTDTAALPVMKLALDNLRLNNFNIVYRDVITGDDMNARIHRLHAKLDTLDIDKEIYSIPLLDVQGLRMRYYQATPLAKNETVAEDMARIGAPITMRLRFGDIRLRDADMDYGNDVSAFYTKFRVGNIALKGKDFDLQHRKLHLSAVHIDNTVSVIRLGRKEQARILQKEIKKEVQVQAQNNWTFQVDTLSVVGNTLQFDNDNKTKQAHGIDYAHFRGDSLYLSVHNLFIRPDSMVASFKDGRVREKSGFELHTLQAEASYTAKAAYLRDFYIKTPGTLLRRDIAFSYPSIDALSNNLGKTEMEVHIDQSRIQVKDILSFAPNLRTHPAFSNPRAVWTLNLQGHGNGDRFAIEALQFSGLKNTSIDASGTIAGMGNPKTIGGNLRIRKLHTSQTDISLFTGQRLSTPDVALPETFSASGTVSGNMSQLRTNLQVASSFGNAGINGTLSNLTSPERMRYNAVVSARGLRLDWILRNKVPVGAVTGTIRMNGSGLTPATINTAFNGTVQSIRYNTYTYRNIRMKGTLKQDRFNVNADIRDPNIDLTATASGRMAANSSFKVIADVDSIKTMPLGFTTQPLTFKGKVNADIASLNADYMDADVRITDALFVSNGERLAMDSLSFVSGHSGKNNFMRLNSDIMNAELTGVYRFSDLGFIIQNNINPYFTISKDSRVRQVQPYDFTFKADITNSPFLSVLVPGLVVTEPIHAEGSLATGTGLQAKVVAPALTYAGNVMTGLNLDVRTTPNGLRMEGTAAHVVSGNSFDVYNARVTGTALNNVFDFNLAVDDKSGRDKYNITGVLRQPATGTFQLQLKPDSLLLNYEGWTVSSDNQLIFGPGKVGANNFVLRKGDQQLSLQSTGGSNGGPLDMLFTNFRIATITGFIKSDSLLLDGVLNGRATFQDLSKQPLFTTDLTVNNLSMRGDTIGDVKMNVYNNAANRYFTNVTITGRGNDVQVTGSMQPQGKDIALDLELAIRQLQLNSFEGAMAAFVKQASGAVNGTVRINGTTSAPKVDGLINFEKATLTTMILGGPLTIDKEQLKVSENGFVFDDFSILDSAGNKMDLNGSLSTVNFINYNFDLDATARNFRILNTERKDNDMYYGQLNVTTNMHVGGTEKNPVIDGNVTVNEGTNLNIIIPQAEPGIVQREGVVEFVDFQNPGNDSLFLAYDSLNKSGLTGFDVSANIDIRKEANFNVIIDAANGDFINLRGEGQLTTGIDQSGKITLTGTYEIAEGAYQFSFNFLRRRFEIEKGSDITWLGEPTSAQLNVTAKYIANTAPLDLVSDQIPEETQRNFYLQKLPFNILLNLSGELMKPQLTFDITLPQEQTYPVSGDIVSTVNNRLAQLRQEPSELNKQVFAVLLLNRFVGENPLQSSGTGFSAGSFARTSVSKLLTEQLNDLASGLIDGVDINFDVSSSDDYTTGSRRARTDLNVGLSKRLLNDRLTITVGSNFQMEGPQQTNQGSNNLAGNIAVNYQLSRDGRYMLRFYRRNEYEGMVDGYVIETGLGFIMTVDYNRFRQIIQARRANRELKKSKRQTENNEKTSV